MGLLEGLGKQPDSFYKKKQYTFEKVLGHGSFGEVKQATWTRPEDSVKLDVAVKVIRKKQLKGETKVVFDEVNLFKELDHPNIGELACAGEGGCELIVGWSVQSSSTIRSRAETSSTLCFSSQEEESSLNASRRGESSPRSML